MDERRQLIHLLQEMRQGGQSGDLYYIVRGSKHGKISIREGRIHSLIYHGAAIGAAELSALQITKVVETPTMGEEVDTPGDNTPSMAEVLAALEAVAAPEVVAASGADASETPAEGSRPHDAARRLESTLAEIIAQFYTREKQTFAYARFIHESTGYAALGKTIEALATFDLSGLETRQEQTAFWLNAYNALCLYSVVADGQARSPQDIKDFFSQANRIIGGYELNLDDIEHGILRSNARKFWGLKAPFTRQDPRRHLALQTLDPRIHFAFYSACLSSPPLWVYQANQIDQHLRMVTSNVLDRKVTLDRDKYHLWTPKPFYWYQKDFGSERDIIAFIAEHLSDEELQHCLSANARDISLKYDDFDWTLNETEDGATLARPASLSHTAEELTT